LIEPLTNQEARPVHDRIDPPTEQPPQGPWPAVIDDTRYYDHGRPWCVNVAAHPDLNGGYPDPRRHLPWDECRGAELRIAGARSELDRAPVGVSVSAAAAFRFGELREHAHAGPARIVLEIWRLATDEPSQRVSLSPPDALHLARILTHAVDEVIFARPAG
jgi:hypothetical protein